MKNVEKALDWMKKESKTPSQSWKSLCQSTCRRAYQMPAYGSSATAAWHSIPKRFKHPVTRYDDKEWWASIPSGAIIYTADVGSWGHAWMCQDAGESAWSVDYLKSGWISECPIKLKNWTSYYKGVSGWVDGTHVYTDNDGYFKGLTMTKWDGKIPPYANALQSFQEGIANKAAYRVSCKLIDENMGDWNPVPYEQKWPTKAWTKWAEANGTDPNHYSETDHAALFA